MKRITRTVLAAIATATFLINAPHVVYAQDKPAVEAGAPVQLPQTQEYQRVLRKHLATLVEKDFDTGVTADMGTPASSTDPDYQYRSFIYTQTPHPLVGSKRGSP